MSLTDMVIMPGADYQAACDAIREKTGDTESIKSGAMAEAIRGIQSGGSSKVLNSVLDRTITEITTDTQVVGAYTFRDCTFLTKADFTNLTEIQTNAFRNTALDTLILRRTDGVCFVDGTYTAVLGETPIYNAEGWVYVPAALLSAYENDEFWSWVSDNGCFRALEDYTVDGTVTGALDESKI